jgi:hypothetical protein
MDKSSTTLLFPSFLIIITIISLFNSSHAQNCSQYTFSNGNLRYSDCTILPVLSSFLHWNYHQFNNTVDIAYRHTGVTSSNWVVWSLNPGRGRMIGAQCLVAFHNSSGLVHAYTSPISDYDTSLQAGRLSFAVPRLSAEFSNNEMIIYATIKLPPGRSSFTHVWQRGDVSGDTPQEHSTKGQFMRSYGTINFATGSTADTGAAGGGSTEREKNVHGVLNVVSWGILMPLGAMAARYLKVFKAANPAWFYLHVTCQVSAYAVGVAGWATGLHLGGEGDEETTHRNIGIILFVLGTLQAFALLLRPKPDHKYRFYWNIYHHAVGYSVIILSIVNILEGFEILDPEKKWKTAYIGVLIFLGANAAVLEAFTWWVVIKRKRQNRSDKHPLDAANGTNGGNRYGA